MSYQFHVNGELYIGRGMPGAARMRIYHPQSGRYIVAFDPDIYSLRSARPCGSWAAIAADIDLTLLEALQPQILSACQARLQRYDEANSRAA